MKHGQFEAARDEKAEALTDKQTAIRNKASSSRRPPPTFPLWAAQCEFEGVACCKVVEAGDARESASRTRARSAELARLALRLRATRPLAEAPTLDGTTEGCKSCGDVRAA